MKMWLAVICLYCLSGAVSMAHTQQAAPPAQAPPDMTDGNGEEPDVPVTPSGEADKKIAESPMDTAWEMLKAALTDTRTQVRPARIDAVIALGTISDCELARKLLRDAAGDPDRYLRLAAVAAMGTSKAGIFIPDLKSALNDPAPEVSFAAAVSLWKMHDRSGESILYAVLAGERKVKRGAVGSGIHQADQDLHSPSKLAEIGAEQGAYALLGPVGFGVDAYRLTRKGNNGNSPQVLAATLLAEDKSPATMQQFLDALDDHNSFVRAAAARVLGDYEDKQVTDALQVAFADPKPAVRLMAAASYIRASQPEPAKPTPRRGTAARSAAQR